MMILSRISAGVERVATGIMTVENARCVTEDDCCFVRRVH